MTTNQTARWTYALNRNEHADLARTHATTDDLTTLCGKAVHEGSTDRLALDVPTYGPPTCRRCREALA